VRDRVKPAYVLLVAGAGGAFAAEYWWAEGMGILLGLMVATATVLYVTGQRAASARLIFSYGYHAGYHGAPASEPCSGAACPILEIAEARVAQLDRISA
jgi:hypothetical protein